MKFGGNSTHQRAGLPTQLLPHAFRVATAMDLLEQGVPVEDVQ